MLLCTTWKARPLSPEQAKRMMAMWGKVEEELAKNPDVERVCWFLNSDGSGGLTVVRVQDADAGAAFGLLSSLMLGEFLELETKVVLDLESAMPVILRGMEAIGA